MDRFQIIQHFFTRMVCNDCQQPFVEDGVELLREEDGYYVVSVSCNHCHRQVGVAMVGIEASAGMSEETDVFAASRRKYADPELTEAEIQRLEEFPPISDDDVLDAHTFFQSLDASWSRLLPPIDTAGPDSGTNSKAV